MDALIHLKLLAFHGLCRGAILLAVTAAWLDTARDCSAQASYGSIDTAEGWAWERISQGEEANLTERCEQAPGVGAEARIVWSEKCREISGKFLMDIMTTSSLRELVPLVGVKLSGAIVQGGISFRSATLNRTLLISQSIIDGDVDLSGAHSNGAIGLVNSTIKGMLIGDQLHCELALDFQSSTFEREVSLNYAKIDSYLDFDGATLGANLSADSLHVGGHLLMRRASFQGVIVISANVTGSVFMDDAEFDGDVIADSLVVGASLSLRSTSQYGAKVILNSAKVGGNVQMEGAKFTADLNADALSVGASLLMGSTAEHTATFNSVTLTSAKVGGNASMEGSVFHGDISAGSLQVGASLFMRSTDSQISSFQGVNLIGAKISGNVELDNARFKNVVLRGANVTRNVSLDGAMFSGKLDAGAMQVGESLFIGSQDHRTSLKEAILTGAKISGSFSLDAALDGNLDADAVQVGTNVDLRHSTSTYPVKMNFAQISGNLDMRGVALSQVDLSGATIAGEFRIGGRGRRGADNLSCTKSSAPGVLILRNTHVTNLMDERTAWPAQGKLHLGGFRFTHLGGYASDNDDASGTEAEMRNRGMEWWDCWVRLDPTYSPTPYEQLAGALTAAGDRTSADEIRYLGRVRQRDTESRSNWIFSGFLQYASGFGIGDRTFRVIYWVLAISASGAFYLWRSVPAARKHGLMWCFGASFSRLLPVIELNKEFSDFFNDPDRARLTDWQILVFSTFSIVGFVLGAILVAAVSGLTQKS